MDQEPVSSVQKEEKSQQERPTHIIGWKSGKKSFVTSISFGIILMLILTLLQSQLSANVQTPLSKWLLYFWNIFVGIIGILIMFTGKISRWRTLFFVVLAWGFILEFKTKLIGLDGKLFTTPEIQEIPYCHIAIVSSILNFFYQHLLALKSGQWSLWLPLSLGFLWLIVTLLVGQAWCSWVCFYGGIDDGFSHIFRKRKIIWFHLPDKLRDFPSALLLFMILVSLGTFLPIFCLWICPLKITTAFLDPNDSIRKVQLFIYVTLGVLALILIPLLTRKRSFCGLLCPFGAWQSFFGKINLFRVTIEPEKCTQCQLCLKLCPIFAISPEKLKKHEISSYCNRCGECIDFCPTSAISYTIFNKKFLWVQPVKAPKIIQEWLDARMFFIFNALLLGGIIGSLFIPSALEKIFKYIF